MTAPLHRKTGRAFEAGERYSVKHFEDDGWDVVDNRTGAVLLHDEPYDAALFFIEQIYAEPEPGPMLRVPRWSLGQWQDEAQRRTR